MGMGRGMVAGGSVRLAAAVALMMAASVAWSAPAPEELLACGAIAAPTERLACFDRYLAAARVQGVEREERAPRAKARPPRPAPVREVVSTVGSVSSSSQGRWTIALADGSVWQSNDAGAPEPRVGQPVHVRKGVLGSYMADIGGARGVVLKRVR
ncbi:hypothetical protein [Sphingomonas sp. 1P08PE]|uniref:hypothetical protein n=1 Tax=Sphingomonas sp. 1P08PE TaxID=554122 RepID=UPI0039A353E7